MKHYIIKKKGETLNWSEMPALQMDVLYRQTQQDVCAFAQIGYTEDALLLHMWISVPSIRAAEYGPLGRPCKDSCLEFFFQPVVGDPRYINLEFNFNGCFYLGVGTCIQDLIRLLPEGDAMEIFQPDIRLTEAGWEIFYQIPYSFIRRIFPNFAAEPGNTIRANCFACSDLSEPRYHMSWSPVVAEPFTFHTSNCFGCMRFEN